MLYISILIKKIKNKIEMYTVESTPLTSSQHTGITTMEMDTLLTIGSGENET